MKLPVIESDEGLETEELILNLGPQHPSTHGVLRLVLKLQGEKVIECIPVMGYLHRGIEKIFEWRTFHQGIRYALVVHAAFRLRDTQVTGYLMIVLSVASLDRLIRAIEDWEHSQH